MSVNLDTWRALFLPIFNLRRCIIKRSSESSVYDLNVGFLSLFSTSSSLALISGRATINSLDVLTILMATYLYILCQALDIRALQAELYEGLNTIITEELKMAFDTYLDDAGFQIVSSMVKKTMREALDATSTMDAADRMIKVAASSTTCMVDFFTGSDIVKGDSIGAALTSIPAFRAQVA